MTNECVIQKSIEFLYKLLDSCNYKLNSTSNKLLRDRVIDFIQTQRMDGYDIMFTQLNIDGTMIKLLIYDKDSVVIHEETYHINEIKKSNRIKKIDSIINL